MPTFTQSEQALIDVWEAHTAAEFELKSADAAIATMTDDPVLIHVPVGTGARGKEPLRQFYAETFIPQIPPDFDMQPLTRSAGQDRIIEEFVIRMTHTMRMDWFAPGVEATGRPLTVPTVGIVHFEGGKIQSEHIYWDQASALRQLGLLDDALPIMGGEQVERLLDVDAPANQLIDRLG